MRVWALKNTGRRRRTGFQVFLERFPLAEYGNRIHCPSLLYDRNFIQFLYEATETQAIWNYTRFQTCVRNIPNNASAIARELSQRAPTLSLDIIIFSYRSPLRTPSEENLQHGSVIFRCFETVPPTDNISLDYLHSEISTSIIYTVDLNELDNKTSRNI